MSEECETRGCVPPKPVRAVQCMRELPYQQRACKPRQTVNTRARLQLLLISNTHNITRTSSPSMLCKGCKSIAFQPHRSEAGSIRPLRDSASEAVYILHRDRASFAHSLSQGCRLCTLIEGRMNKTHSASLPSGYRSMNAYIILKCSVSRDSGLGGQPRSLTVISLRGTFALDIVDEPSSAATRSRR